MTKLEMIVKALNNEVEKLKKETDNTPADTTFIRSELEMIVKSLTDEVENLKTETKKILSIARNFAIAYSIFILILEVILLFKFII